MFAKFRSIPLAVKIPTIIIGVVLVAIVGTGYVANIAAEDAVHKKIKMQMETVKASRIDALEDWLATIKGDILVQATNPTVIEALSDFTLAWDSLFVNHTEKLQSLYITDNPYPIGEKDKLVDAGDGSTYSREHKRFHPYFSKLLNDRGYYDIFLIDKTGNLVYSVFKELDFATNLMDGEWASSDLGHAFRAVKENPKADMVNFFDFKPYGPSNGAPASFISTALFDNVGRFIGVLAFQMPIDRLNRVMQQSAGLGETGETYLVGEDNLMRSDSRFSQESTILKTEVDTEVIAKAFEGENGLFVGSNHNGRESFISYTTLSFEGVTWAVIGEQARDEAFAEIDRLHKNLLVTSLVGIAICAIIGLLVGRSISLPISKMTGKMESLAGGNLNEEVPYTNRGDEIGKMAAAVEIFKQNGLENKRLSEQIERDQAEAEEAKRRAISEFAEEISGLATSASDGDLSARLRLDGKDGELLAVSEELNRLVSTVESGLNETAQMLSALAEGDLSQRMVQEYQGAFLKLKQDSNLTAETLGKIVVNITEASELVNSATFEIAEGTKDLASRTEKQASSLEQTAAAMEVFTETVRQNADNAAQASQLSMSARESAEKGGEVVSNAVSAMSRISESSQKITDIVSMIDEIAFQTNLLALNAAVEAARAGEAGKGFAVVASEVRALAQRSSDASREIKELIEASSSQVSEGVELVNHTGETLEEIVTSVKRVADIVSEIASASQEQSTGLSEVNTAIAAMDDMTQKNAALVEQTSAAAQSMRDQSSGLSRQVQFFKSSAQSEQTNPAQELHQEPHQELNQELSQEEPHIAEVTAQTQPQKQQAADGARLMNQKLAAAVNGGSFDHDPGWEEF